MIFKFKNSFSEPIDFILEPSADLITLANADLLEIIIEGCDLQYPFNFEFVENGFMLWLPRNSLIKVFVNGIKVDTLYEEFDW
jgi:hypothetical protein